MTPQPPESPATPQPVLPLLTPIEGMPSLDRIDDLLTAEEKAQLHSDLAEMARLRRQAAAEASTWVLP